MGENWEKMNHLEKEEQKGWERPSESEAEQRGLLKGQHRAAPGLRQEEEAERGRLGPRLHCPMAPLAGYGGKAGPEQLRRRGPSSLPGAAPSAPALPAVPGRWSLGTG